MSSIELKLSRDEALVLFELFARFDQTGTLSVGNNAEFVALGRISAQLDKALVEPFGSNYHRLLTEAQARLAEGGEGPLP